MENQTTPLLRKIDWDGRPIRLLVDFSAVCYRSAFGGISELQKSGFTDWAYFKYQVITFVVDVKKKFGDAVQEVVIAVDKKDENNKYWRNNILESYKQQRKNISSPIPKDIMHKEFNTLEQEIHENLPWKVVAIPSVESDDIIGTLCERFSSDIIIVMGVDKDYYSLQVNPNVKMFNIKTHDIDVCPNPKFFKFSHYITGDTTDNIRSIFYDPSLGRQKPIRGDYLKKMFKILCENGTDEFRKQFLPTKELEQKFIVNRKLIDLTMIPSEIKKKINEAYDSSLIKGNMKTAWHYFAKNGLRYLIDRVNQL